MILEKYIALSLACLILWIQDIRGGQGFSLYLKINPCFLRILYLSETQIGHLYKSYLYVKNNFLNSLKK
ncbi:hypothetical protein CMV62_04190 [Klebsiella pneumoniae]|nr:hypothetical protein CMV62_04190 [Klebsiella pneumoniae]